MNPQIDWLRFQSDIKRLWGAPKHIKKKMPLSSGTMNRFWNHGGQIPARYFLCLCRISNIDPMTYLILR